MQVSCPFCQHAIEIDRGGQYTCEKCRAIFRVDMDAPSAGPLPPPTAGGAGVPPAPGRGPEARAPQEGLSSGLLPPTPPSAPPPGARCARHPEQEAVAVCSRCGNFTCGACSVLLPTG